VDAKIKDASPPLLQLGTVRRTASPSLRSEPKSDAPLQWKNSLSLTDEERATVYDETRAAIPDSDAKAFALKYKLALWEADVKKMGSNPGGNLGNVDLSSLSETDDEEDSGEDTDSSDDGMKVIADDLERQKKVSPPSSPKENRYLVGFMKSSDKQPQDAQAKQALDKDPISLFSPLEQAVNEASAKKQGQRTGDVTGHGGSMSVQHGSFPLSP
jgi:hypothetical protein